MACIARLSHARDCRCVCAEATNSNVRARSAFLVSHVSKGFAEFATRASSEDIGGHQYSFARLTTGSDDFRPVGQGGRKGRTAICALVELNRCRKLSVKNERIVAYTRSTVEASEQRALSCEWVERAQGQRSNHQHDFPFPAYRLFLTASDSGWYTSTLPSSATK